MVKTTILVAVLILMLSAGFVITSWDRADEGVKILNDDDYEDIQYESVGGNMNIEYQGPVPVGYDLEYFRKTGETIKEDVH